MIRCPGADHDDVNEVPGSLPIEVEQGTMTQQVTEVVEETTEREQVLQELSLDTDAETFYAEQATYYAALAVAYGVPVCTDEITTGCFTVATVGILCLGLGIRG